MGGGFALSLAPGHGFVAASANYGMIPKDAEQYFVGACPIIASYGGRDLSLRGAGPKLEAALTAAGVEHEVDVYPQAGHGFLNDHGPGEVPFLFQLMAPLTRNGYHRPSAELARERIVAFLTTPSRGADRRGARHRGVALQPGRGLGMDLPIEQQRVPELMADLAGGPGGAGSGSVDGFSGGSHVRTPAAWTGPRASTR